MRIKIDESLLKKAEVITWEKYEQDIDGYISLEDVFVMIENLATMYEQMEEKYNDLEREIQDNYKKISVAEQVEG